MIFKSRVKNVTKKITGAQENNKGIPDEIINEISKIRDQVIFESVPLQRWKFNLSFKWIPRYENDIMANVYLGAAILVVVLGLRGLGSQIPEFLKDPVTHRLHAFIIYFALFFEFLMIAALAFAFKYKIEENHGFYDQFIPKGSENLDSSLSLEEAVKKLEHEIEQNLKRLNQQCRVLKNIQEEIEKLGK